MRKRQRDTERKAEQDTQQGYRERGSRREVSPYDERTGRIRKVRKLEMQGEKKAANPSHYCSMTLLG